MSVAKAQHVLLERLAGSDTVLVAVLLDLTPIPAWADGVDAEGRTIVLVGKTALGMSAEAQAVATTVVSALAAGRVPDGVRAVAYAPAASAAIAEIVAGAASEVLLHGPRGTGKTQATPAALAILAEWHAREGFPWPLKVLWLHDSLANASMKTAPSLENPTIWGGLWQIRDNRRRAVFTMGGRELIVADFVGTQDPMSGDRTRAECHATVAEEVIPSLNESGGIAERDYEMALSSFTTGRLPTRRHVGVCVTNPGAPETWPYQRFLAPGHSASCVAVAVPASDRMTDAQQAALLASFRTSPDLQARLARGEWAALLLGPRVAEGFDPAVHVSRQRLSPHPDYVLAIGWDGGHSPSAVIGQVVQGQVRIYAALNDLHVGVLELIEQQVIPWLLQHAPWTREGQHGHALVHVLDPSMSIAGQATILQSAETVIASTLRGRIVKGPSRWNPRREAVLRVLAPRHEQGHSPLVINPVDTRLLIDALSSRWYYPQTPDGRVDRTGAKKPNSPWADVGDAFAYVVDWLWGGEPMTLQPQPVSVRTEFALSLGAGATLGREARA